MNSGHTYREHKKKCNEKVTKGNNSVISLETIMVLIHCTSSYCAWPLNSNQYFSSYASDKEKGNDSLISQDGVMFFCALHCMKLYWIPKSGVQVMLWTRKNNGKVTKGNNYVITLDRVMLFVHCTYSYCAWLLYEIVFNSNQYFSSYARNKEKYQRAIPYS
jgi:hypothetical protein